MQKNKKLLLFLIITFIFNFLFALFYFNDQSNKQSAYTKSILASGYEYIVPEGHKYLFGDADAYNKFAYTLLEKGDFYNPIGQVSAWVTPGYPLFLSAVYLIFGYFFLPVLIIQNILLSFVYLLIFKTTFLITESLKTSWVAISLYFINIRFTTFVQSVYTEIFFLFLLSLLLYLLFKIVTKKEKICRKYIHYFTLGFVAGLVILVRPISLPFILVLIGYLFYKKIKLNYILIVLILMSFVVSLWLIRNYLDFGRILMSTNSEITMGAPYLDKDNFNFLDNYDLHVFTHFNSRRTIDSLSIEREMQNKNIFIPDSIRLKINQGYIYEQISYLFVKDSKDWIIANPVLYFIRSAYLFKTVLSPYTLDLSLRYKVIATIIWFLTIFPAFLYLFLKDKNKYFFILFIAGLSLVILPSMTFIDSNLRYQLPLQLVFSIISALFWSKILNSGKNENLNNHSKL